MTHDQDIKDYTGHIYARMSHTKKITYDRFNML